MVNKNTLLSLLNEANALEELQILPILNDTINKIRDSTIDDILKKELEEKLWRLHVETINHAKTLTGYMKKVIASERDEY